MLIIFRQDPAAALPAAAEEVGAADDKWHESSQLAADPEAHITHVKDKTQQNGKADAGHHAVENGDAQVKLGIDAGILKVKNSASIYKMMMNSQPSCIQYRLGQNAGSEKRERLRAEYINQNLPELIS